MSNKKTLQDLLNENVREEDNLENIVEIPLDKIKPNPYQPRYVFDEVELNDLAASIREHGVIQPIIVKEMGNYYVIIAGERRFRASQLLNKPTIPAVVRQYEKSKMIELALIENLQRQNLSPIEEAKAYSQIMRELDLTQKEVATRVGKTRSYVTNMLGLLNLPEEVMKLVDAKKISMGHARALSKLLDKEKIKVIAKKIVEQNLSVRDVEKLVSSEEKTKPVAKKEKAKETLVFENRLSTKFNTVSKINKTSLLLNFKSKEELEDFINKLLED